MARVLRLSWRRNADGYDVALAVDRLLACGLEACWLPAPAPPAEPGDYLIAGPDWVPRVLSKFGLATEPHDGPLPAGGRTLAAPSVALFTGPATGYPYWGYYALCLLRLGLPYVPVDGKAMAAGALDAANLFVIPGGFATWGFDRAEDAPGADAQVRRFLDEGGAAIGSCGGAFYLSAGRPGWTGTAQAMPLYTQEYLKSGVGVISLDLAPGPLASGLPPSIDMPYYHGPIYGAVGAGVEVAARFRELVMPGGVAIDNPLDHERFARDMAGRPAILRASGPRGRAVLFSPHPEMGDLLRKYIALDGYARKYLPIRGLPVLRDTMRFYVPADSPSFRLVLNAVHDLLGDGARAARSAPAMTMKAGDAPGAKALADALAARLGALPPADDVLAPLVEDMTGRLRARIGALSAPTEQAEGTLGAVRDHLAQAIMERLALSAEQPFAQALMEIELAIALMETWSRVAAFDALVREAR